MYRRGGEATASASRPTAFENFEIARSNFSLVNYLPRFQDQIPEVRFDVRQVDNIDAVQAYGIVDGVKDSGCLVPRPRRIDCKVEVRTGSMTAFRTRSESARNAEIKENGVTLTEFCPS